MVWVVIRYQTRRDDGVSSINVGLVRRDSLLPGRARSMSEECPDLLDRDSSVKRDFRPKKCLSWLIGSLGSGSVDDILE